MASAKGSALIPAAIVDAFVGEGLAGNPAAVCVLKQELSEEQMQSIAAEFNLSETAFVDLNAEPWRLRWFTPETEVDLCGHATLATAYVLRTMHGMTMPRLRFQSRSGELTVAALDDGRLELDFPAFAPTKAELPEGLDSVLGARPLEFYDHLSYNLALFDSPETVLSLKPDMQKLTGYYPRAVCVTAAGNDPRSGAACDYVVRLFAPSVGVDEDPVTGSAQCILAPYWAERLGKTTMVARQISERGGELHVRVDGERVRIAGRARTFLRGTLEADTFGRFSLD